MGKTAIVYATLTRHSKKIAEAIGRALGVKAENISDLPALENMDLLFIVGGIYGGKSLPALLNYVGALEAASVKKAVLVTSSAREQKQDHVRRLLQEKGIEVLDEFTCPGSFLFISHGRPNKEDLQQAAGFALRLAERINGE